MKRTIIISVIALVIVLCGCIPEYNVDKQGRPVAVQAKTDKTDSAAKKNCYYFEFNRLSVTLKYMMFDGHEYVVARTDKGLGITHSPRCTCRK